MGMTSEEGMGTGELLGTHFFFPPQIDKNNCCLLDTDISLSFEVSGRKQTNLGPWYLFVFRTA